MAKKKEVTTAKAEGLVFVHQEPSEQSLVCDMYKDEPVNVLEVKGDWVRCDKGYILKYYLSF